jgi:hypothetical protein
METQPVPNRRIVLRSITATMALPWLESAKLFGVEEKKDIPKRFGFLFFGDGIHPPEWWAKGSGPKMELGPAFETLGAVKGKLNVINGLEHSGGFCGGHAQGAAGILTGQRPLRGREIRAATSMDQVLAQKLGDKTAISSLVLSCERAVSGFHESGNSMMYASHVSWASPVSPIPPELYPAMAFDSLFESRGSRSQISILDHVGQQLKDVSRKVSVSDRAKLDEYATSVREVEKRLERFTASPAQGDTADIRSKRPPEELPTGVDEHAKLMCDIIAMAFQADRTRIATLLLTNNLSGQIYPFLGLRNDHHSFSHSWQGQDFAAITRFWVGRYAYLLEKLDRMQEGEGTVLDNSCILLANEQWTAHSSPKHPLLMAGSLGGSIETARTLDFENSKNRKMCGLYLNLMERMGVKLPAFGDATEAHQGV